MIPDIVNDPNPAKNTRLHRLSSHNGDLDSRSSDCNKREISTQSIENVQLGHMENNSFWAGLPLFRVSLQC
jgi:hypothetical protein